MISSAYFPPVLLSEEILPRLDPQEVYLAVYDGDVDKIQRFLDEGLDPDWVYDYYQVTLLYIAADEGHVDMVCELIKRKVNVNKYSNNGKHPLSAAVLNGHADIVEELLKAGVDPDQVISDYGSTGLYAAVNQGNLEVVRVFLKYNADMEIIFECGLSVLMCAAQKDNLNIVTELVAEGVSVNTENQFGVSALGVAHYNNHSEIVSFLLKNGAKNNIFLHRKSFVSKSINSERFLKCTLGIDICDDKVFSRLSGILGTALPLRSIAMRVVGKRYTKGHDINALPIPTALIKGLLELNGYTLMPFLDK